MNKILRSSIRILALLLFGLLLIKGNMGLWLLLFGVTLVATLFLGRVYCGWICPMNTMMIPVAKLSKKLRWQNKNIPKWGKIKSLPWVVLLLMVMFMVVTQRILQINVPFLLILFVTSILITLHYKPVVFHNGVCPFGVLQKLFSKKPLLSERVDKEKCNGCTACVNVCPADSITMNNKNASIQSSSCLQCFSCSDACPKTAISYKKTIFTESS